MSISGFLSFIWYQTFWKPHPLPPDVRLDGQTAIITGSNVGLGYEAAKQLAEHGISRLILAVRNTSKGEGAKATILSHLQSQPRTQKEASSCAIEVWPLDQESYPSIIAFAARVKTDLDRLDLVLLNAGLKFTTRHIVPETGHEAHVQVNHLGTALLSLLLLDPLRRTTHTVRRDAGLGPARLSITSSSVYAWVSPYEVLREETRTAGGLLAWLDEPASFPKPEPGGGGRYSLSKLLGVLWARELADHVSSHDVVINMFNPGYCMSDFHRSDPTADAGGLVSHVAWTAQQGGYHLTDAVVLHPESHGMWLSEQQIRPISKFVASSKGKIIQERLWDETLAVFQKQCPGPHLDEFKDW
ncbi:short-chain dehydrogenase/reductase SDR [Xylaria venustula]|nr:short-chain dehydrogenase/reductase SDR [Xylaria venustula]